MLGRAVINRLRTRIRKFYRDPVAFAIDLPNPLLAYLLRGLIVVLMALSDLIDFRTWAARWEWRARRMRLGPLDGIDAVTDWVLRGPRGGSPRFWPSRLILTGNTDAVVCALSSDGVFLAGATLAPGRHAVLSVMRKPFSLRVYSLESRRGGVRARPGASIEILALELSRGVVFDTALKRAWPARARSSPHVPVARYRKWLEKGGNEPPPPPSTTLISVLMPVRDPPEVHLREAIRSILDQTHATLELCIADDGSTSGAVRRVLSEAAGDPRVQISSAPMSRGIAVATNAAMEMAKGTIIAFVDHDDVLEPDALGRMAEAFGDPSVQVAYSDEDSLDAHGRRSAPVFKSAFNVERLLSQNYINHLLCVRAGLLRQIGGLRPGLDGSQDHDLILRLSETVPPEGFRHVPHILYHWRSYPGGLSFSQTQGGVASSARKRAVEDHLRRRGLPALVSEQSRGLARIHWPLPDPLPTVQVIVPTCDRPDLLGPA